MVNLVTWDESLRDSGEGGMWGVAIFPETEQNCHVDAEPNVGNWDVLLKAVGPMAEDFRVAEEINARDYPYAQGVSGGATVFLGSTGLSLYNEREAEYFTVTRETLTPEGLELIATLEKFYGEATFLTFLDT